MSILTHSPAIVRDGLVLCLDAGLNRSTNALADTGHPTKAGQTYGGPGVEDDYQPAGCQLISRADKTIQENTDLRKYDNNVVANWTGAVTGGGVSVTYVDGANGFYGYLNTGYGFTSNPVVGKRYRIVIRAKTNTGTIYLSFYDGVSASTYINIAVGTTMKTYTHDFTCLHATNAYVYGAGSFGAGEVAYFDRYEVYELSPWLDVSGNDNHGDMANAPTFSAESGAGGTKSFDFDGSSDYISLGTSSGVLAPPLNTVSVFAWVKLDSTSGWSGVFGTYSGGSFIHFQIYSGGMNVYLYGPNIAYGSIDSESYLSAGEWAHIGFTYDSTVLTVYINGQSMPTKPTTSSTANVTTVTEVSIGRVYSSSRMFDGKISIVHAYNRGLTATEVAQNYRTHKGRFGK